MSMSATKQHRKHISAAAPMPFTSAMNSKQQAPEPAQSTGLTLPLCSLSDEKLGILRNTPGCEIVIPIEAPTAVGMLQRAGCLEPDTGTASTSQSTLTSAAFSKPFVSAGERLVAKSFIGADEEEDFG